MFNKSLNHITTKIHNVVHTTPQGKSFSESTPGERYSAMAFMMVVTLLFGAEPASANILDNFGNAILLVLNNNFLRAIAIGALIVMAILALGGKVSAGAFIITLLAITIVFGAAGVVDFIRANAGTGGTTTSIIPDISTLATAKVLLA